MRKPLLLILFVLSNVLALGQCMLYPVALSDRIQNADVIVEASVAYDQSFWNASQDLIYTSTVLNVHKVFKGNLLNVQIELITEGGTVGNIKQKVDPGIELKTNHTGVFFLKYASQLNPNSSFNSALQFETYASVQGLISYNEDGTAQEPFNLYSSINNIYSLVSAVTQQPFTEITPLPSKNSTVNFSMVPPTITGIAPNPANAGVFTTVTITGTNFGASYVAGTSNLEFRDANNGGAGFISTPANHIISWNATTIQAWVVTGAGSGTFRVTNNLGEQTLSGMSLTVNYNETNVNSGGTYYQPDLVNDNGTAGYTWAYNTTFNGNAPAVAAWERALQTWRCGTFVNFNRSGTTAISCQALDGSNIVTFDGACALPAGVLGISYSYYSACGGGTWYVSENDLKFRTNGTGGINWNYGPAATAGGLFDFESVCLHELGHSHQLGHTILPVTVMNYAVGPNTDRRTLTPASETAGGNDIMSRSVINNACGPTAMVALTAGTCAINAPVANFSGTPLTGCNSVTVTFTDLSINTPTSWNWTFTGGVPASFVGQNPPPVSFGAPGTYTVTLVVTNASGNDTETKTNYITVNSCPPPVANFSALPNNLCAGGVVQFTDLSTNTPTSWSWTFPGGTPAASAAQNPVVQYNVPGTYNVTLTATNAYGNNTLTKTNYIVVSNCPPPPVVNFSAAPTTVCTGATVNFTDLSTNSPTTWQWTFPGGTPATSIAQNPVVVYNTAGVYNVTLVASNASGPGMLTKTAYITVNVCTAPTANFAGYPTTVCAGSSVNFVDLSTQSPTSWSWTFFGGAPGASAAQNPTVTYAAAGSFAVSLTATNAFGSNSKTVAAYINVVACPSAGSGLIVNDGADIHVQAGALVHVDGGVINQDNGANIGLWQNLGTVRIQGDWTNTSIANGFVPAQPGTVELFGAAQQITGTVPTFFNTLSLTGSGIKTQTLNAQVDGILSLNDRELATQAFTMTVTNTAVAAITRTGGLNSTPIQGFVSSLGAGKLVRNTASTGTYYYYVGSSIPTARFRPLALKPASSAANTFGVRFVNNDPTLDGFNKIIKEPTLGNINGYWYHKVNHPSGSSATDITIYADNVQDAIASWPLLKMAEWGAAAPPVWWKDMGPVTTAGAVSPVLGSVTKTAWNFFITENFSIAPQSNPLPVELAYLGGTCNNKDIIVKWITVSEQNNSHFILERSNDNIHFEFLAEVSGNGTTSDLHNYIYTDKNAASIKVYYRLSQVDFNGAVHQHPVIAVSCNNEHNDNSMVIYPVPSRDKIYADISASGNKSAKIQVVNMLGQVVISKEIALQKGNNTIQIGTASLAADMYQIVFVSDTNVITKRFTKAD